MRTASQTCACTCASRLGRSPCPARRTRPEANHRTHSPRFAFHPPPRSPGRFLSPFPRPGPKARDSLRYGEEASMGRTRGRLGGHGRRCAGGTGERRARRALRGAGGSSRAPRAIGRSCGPTLRGPLPHCADLGPRQFNVGSRPCIAVREESV